jgi:hypothetical protein
MGQQPGDRAQGEQPPEVQVELDSVLAVQS